jgi:predicted TIM-barrel fold metal-dependent hydrolase
MAVMLRQETTLIIDSHCHAWPRWPYDPPVPDDESRGRIDQLLFEMDRNGVDQAVLICARIDRNPDNNDYIAEQAAKRPDRIHQFPDIDCFWTDTYHAAGAVGRLKETADRWPIKGFTHYLRDDDDGAWLYSNEGLEFFAAASERNLIASISCLPYQQPAIRELARRLPELSVVCHHLGGVKARDEGADHAGLKQVLASAGQPNVYIKVSGFYYGALQQFDYPHSDVHWVVKALYESFGPHRLCWGSDYPVCAQHITYRQSLEAFRTHCGFIAVEDRERILGKTMNDLLMWSGPARKV